MTVTALLMSDINMIIIHINNTNMICICPSIDKSSDHIIANDY